MAEADAARCVPLRARRSGGAVRAGELPGVAPDAVYLGPGRPEALCGLVEGRGHRHRVEPLANWLFTPERVERTKQLGLTAAPGRARIGMSRK